MKKQDDCNSAEKKIVICPFCNIENTYKINEYQTEEQKNLPATHLVSCKNCGEQFQITVKDQKSRISFGWPLI